MFAGKPPARWSWQGFVQTTQHLPAYIQAIVQLAMYRVPMMIYLAMQSRMHTAKWIPPVSPSAAFRLVVNTPLILVASLNGDRNVLTLRIPSDLPVTWLHGGKIAGMTVEFDVHTGCILTAMQNGAALRPERVSLNALVLASLHLACYGWVRAFFSSSAATAGSRRQRQSRLTCRPPLAGTRKRPKIARVCRRVGPRHYARQLLRA